MPSDPLQPVATGRVFFKLRALSIEVQGPEAQVGAVASAVIDTMVTMLKGDSSK
jgi:hypothetical protein